LLREFVFTFELIINVVETTAYSKKSRDDFFAQTALITKGTLKHCTEVTCIKI